VSYYSVLYTARRERWKRCREYARPTSRSGA
jgi:hypothetical protein